MNRKILIITGSRGEYGYIRPIIRLIKQHECMSYETVVTNMHLLEDFGCSEEEFMKDGIDVTYRIYNTLSGYNTITMPKSLGLFLVQIPEVILQSRPDIVLISGDRGEMFMAAMAAAHMNIPVAHVQAGELSGNIDGHVRHAITKISHIHFASTQDAYDRVLRLGEEDFRVFLTGAPLVDELVDPNFVESKVRDIYGINKDKGLILCVQHPVTEDYSSSFEDAHNLFTAVGKIDDMEVVVILPNSDAGSNLVRKALSKFSDRYKVFDNLPRSHYLGFMNSADIMVGNSSSGIMEAPTFKLPVVNVGRRQVGREQASNVINTGTEVDSISEGIRTATSSEMAERLKKCLNPYGDGQSSAGIVTILNDIDINDKLLNKRMSY